MYRNLPLLLLVLPLLSCSPVYVTYTDQVEGKALADYQTFAFAPVDVDNQSTWQTQSENLDRVQALIAQELQARGLEPVTSDPDLLVNLGVVITDEVQTRQTDIRDAPRYVGGRNYHWESEEIVVREYTSGTLMMDVVDNADEQLIWQSAVKSTLTENQDKMRKRVEAAIDQLFKGFPKT